MSKKNTIEELVEGLLPHARAYHRYKRDDGSTELSEEVFKQKATEALIKARNCACVIENNEVIESCKLHADLLTKAQEDGYVQGIKDTIKLREEGVNIEALTDKK